MSRLTGMAGVAMVLGMVGGVAPNESAPMLLRCPDCGREIETRQVGARYCKNGHRMRRMIAARAANEEGKDVH